MYSSCRSKGFTLLEMLVAMAAMVVVTGVALYLLGQTERFRVRAEKRWRQEAQWQAFLSQFERETAGLYYYQGDQFTQPAFEILDGGHRLRMVTAVDNPGNDDHVEVIYYLSPSGGLCRKVRYPGEAEPADDDSWLYLPDATAFSVQAVMNGSLPASVTVTMMLTDPADPEQSLLYKATFSVETSAP